MRISLIINKPSRELVIMEKIKEELLNSSNDNQVEFHHFSQTNFLQSLLRFKPDVVMTFPFTSIGLSKYFYILKFMFKTKVIILRTEGAFNYDSEDWASKYWIRCAAGYDKYNWKLVDKEIFWGPKLASVVGPELLRQKKVLSLDDVLTIGNPRYEDLVNSKELLLPLDSEKLTRIQEFPREKRILILTGFHMADYTVEDYYRAGDLDAENNLENLLAFTKASQQLREAYIKMTVELAKNYPDMLFLFKKHPLEKVITYSEPFKNIHNIMFVSENIDSQAFISNVGLLIQYGSTVLMESYLAKVPSIYAYLPKTEEFYTSLGWPSTVECETSQVVPHIESYRNKSISYSDSPKSLEVLKNSFNISPGTEYRPSKIIAEELLKPARKIGRLQILLDPLGFYNLLKMLKMIMRMAAKGELRK